jgi:hypothetical protein
MEVGGKHDAPVFLPPRTNPGIHWIGGPGEPVNGSCPHRDLHPEHAIYSLLTVPNDVNSNPDRLHSLVC